jgi:hypothetical protein
VDKERIVAANRVFDLAATEAFGRDDGVFVAPNLRSGYATG